MASDHGPSTRDDDARGVEATLVGMLVVFSLALFARAADFDFVDFDDRRVLLSHPNLFNEVSFAASLSAIFIDYFPREEPLLLRDVTWALDARIFGLANPVGFHLGNVVLNALNVGLLFILIRRWTADLWVAGIVASLFAVLPVHVEAICWAMGRKDLLAAFFMLLGLLAQTAELSSDTSKQRGLFRAWVFACTVCALLSKASSVAFVLVLGLHRILHRSLVRKQASVTASSPETIPRFVVAMAPPLLATIAFVFWYQGILSAWGILENDSPGPLDPIHLQNVATFIPLIFGRYLLSLAGVVELSMFYRWPHVAIPLSGMELLASGLIAVAFVAGLVVLWMRRRDLFFYALASLALLAPYTGLQYVGFWAADRYLYLASAFVLAAAVIPLVEWARSDSRARFALVTLGVGWMLMSGVQTWLQQEVWRNNESLWSYEAYREQPSLLSIQALAKHYLKQAEVEREPKRRLQWITRAEGEIARGFARQQELGLQATPYKIRETLHEGRLHYLQGRVKQLQGAPAQEQLVHFRRAFQIAPDRLTAMMISGGLFEMATRVDDQGTRRALFEESFDLFMIFVEMGHRDPKRLAQSRELLARNYEGRFPFLEDRIAEAKRVYFQ